MTGSLLALSFVLLLVVGSTGPNAAAPDLGARGWAPGSLPGHLSPAATAVLLTAAYVLGGLGVLSGLFAVASPQAGQPGFLVGLSLFSFLLTAAGIVLLALKPSNDWYRFRKWQRLTGQG